MKKTFLQKIGVPVSSWDGCNGKPIYSTPFIKSKNIIGFRLTSRLGRFYFKQMFLKQRDGNLPKYIWFSHLIFNIACFVYLPVIWYQRNKLGYSIIGRYEE